MTLLQLGQSAAQAVIKPNPPPPMRALVFDTETANFQKGVCDIAIMQIDKDFNVLWSVESPIDPECPISPGASAIHHIVDEDVADAPTLAEFMEANGNPFDCDDLVTIGHNVQFDNRMISAHLPQHYHKLCTLKLARLIWPEADNHQLQTLRYTFRLEAGTAHRAMGDVITCVSLLRRAGIENGVDLLGLLALVQKPLSLDTPLTFGKHKGTPLGKLPSSYVDWLLNKADNLDPDIRQALATR